jgi:hypothetical protein
LISCHKFDQNKSFIVNISPLNRLTIKINIF